MAKNEYWWIQNEKGNLVTVGRERDGSHIMNSGCPNLQYQKKFAQQLCHDYETPVKVVLIKHQDEKRKDLMRRMQNDTEATH